MLLWLQGWGFLVFLFKSLEHRTNKVCGYRSRKNIESCKIKYQRNKEKKRVQMENWECFTLTDANWNTREINHHRFSPSFSSNPHLHVPLELENIFRLRRRPNSRTLCVVYTGPKVSWKARSTQCQEKAGHPWVKIFTIGFGSKRHG